MRKKASDTKSKTTQRKIKWSALKQPKTWGFIGIGIVGTLMLIQLGYPFGRVAPFAELDRQYIGGLRYDDANEQLRDAYKQEELAIYFGENTDPYESPTLSQLGIEVDASEQVGQLGYGWWRLVPTSIFWAHAALQPDEPEYSNTTEAYARDRLGDNCDVEPQNASLRADDNEVVVVEASDGGRCDIDDVITSLALLQPKLSEDNKVRLELEVIAPDINNEQAQALADTINERLDITVAAGNSSEQFAPEDVVSWLEFGDELELSVMTEGALSERLSQHVAREPGTTKVVTRDFAEISRDEGTPGQALNVAATEEVIADYLTGQREDVEAAVRGVPARVEYERSYSPTDRGLNALLRNFAEDNDGVYGIALAELSGQRRRAEHQGNRQFATASTYKVYVAYSTLKRVERGDMQWSQNIVGGKNLEQCFEEMIALSDNPCSEKLVEMIGYNALHREAREVGATNTTFIDEETFRTTAGDLTEFLARLETNQLSLSDSSRERLLATMGRNIFRQGIPAGASGNVLNKVGFIEDYLHDAAVVRSPNGTYVLTIMTDRASWGLIAELTREVERLRSQ